jgi:hypothetical protein
MHNSGATRRTSNAWTDGDTCSQPLRPLHTRKQHERAEQEQHRPAGSAPERPGIVVTPAASADGDKGRSRPRARAAQLASRASAQHMFSLPIRATCLADPHCNARANRQPTRLTFSSLAPFEPTTLETLPALMHDLPPAVYASKLSKKLVPLSNPPRPSAHAAVKTKAKARRQADKVRQGTVGLLSRKEAKRKAVWAPGRGELAFGRLRGLAELWEGYARDLLGLASASGLAGLRLNGANLVEGNVEGLLGKLAKAEFVGATLTGASPCLGSPR